MIYSQRVGRVLLCNKEPKRVPKSEMDAFPSLPFHTVRFPSSISFFSLIFLNHPFLPTLRELNFWLCKFSIVWSKFEDSRTIRSSVKTHFVPGFCAIWFLANKLHKATNCSMLVLSQRNRKLLEGATSELCSRTVHYRTLHERLSRTVLVSREIACIEPDMCPNKWLPNGVIRPI